MPESMARLIEALAALAVKDYLREQASHDAESDDVRAEPAGLSVLPPAA